MTEADPAPEATPATPVEAVPAPEASPASEAAPTPAPETPAQPEAAPEAPQTAPEAPVEAPVEEPTPAPVEEPAPAPVEEFRVQDEAAPDLVIPADGPAYFAEGGYHETPADHPSRLRPGLRPTPAGPY